MALNVTNGKGQWTKGISGNPAGRPTGSRNRSTVLMEELLEGQSEVLISMLINLALSGNVAALRLCLDRLLPVRRHRPINLNLAEVRTAKDVTEAMSQIVAATAEGQITPNDGEAMTNILSFQLKALSVADLDQRNEAVESSKAGVSPHHEAEMKPEST